jgi:predicted HicB family RNase H-like nuclease
MMQYKGYLGAVEYDDEAKLFHGEVLNMRDVITFQGTNVEEIEQAFRESVDDYLAWCKEDGIEPEKPYSGRFNLRISPELHQKLATAAKKKRMSINHFVEQAGADKVVSVLE